MATAPACVPVVLFAVLRNVLYICNKRVMCCIMVAESVPRLCRGPMRLVGVRCGTASFERRSDQNEISIFLCAMIIH